MPGERQIMLQPSAERLGRRNQRPISLTVVVGKVIALIFMEDISEGPRP